MEEYGFASNTALSRFTLGCSEEDIFRMCSEVSGLK